MQRILRLLLQWIPVITTIVELIHGALPGDKKKKLATAAVESLWANAKKYNAGFEEVPDAQVADLVSHLIDSNVGALNVAGAFKRKAAKKIA